jgi:putative tryptophan/tyrosine transport system substrate-binding protein
MQRREFITLVGGAAAAWPVVVTAAQEAGKGYRIAYLGSSSPAASGRYVAGFLDTLRGLGYTEGQNFVITYRWAEGKFDQLPTLVDELLRDKPDIIVGFGGPQLAIAVKSATSTLPAVILTNDPVAEGLVESLARPGGNLTGVSLLQEEATPALEPLRMAKKLDPYRETARVALEPWLVEAALARLSQPLSPADQRIVVKATRTPRKVRWPEWWSENS